MKSLRNREKRRPRTGGEGGDVGSTLEAIGESSGEAAGEGYAAATGPGAAACVFLTCILIFG